MNPQPHGWVGLGEGSRGTDKAKADSEPPALGKPKQPPQHAAFESQSCVQEVVETVPV